MDVVEPRMGLITGKRLKEWGRRFKNSAKQEVWTMSDAEFFSKLSTGPSVLILGQSYLRLRGRDDAFLRAVLGEPNEERAASYDSIFALQDTSIKRMLDLCSSIPSPDWLGEVAELPWNAVFTSAIDVVWLEAFRRQSWRTVQPIADPKLNPQDPRNPLNLKCTFLFGSVEGKAWPDTPPLSPFELKRHRLQAVTLLQRLAETATPLGLIVVEGLDEKDWLSLDDLLPVLSELNPGQVHWFSFSSQLNLSEDIVRLRERGLIKCHEESFISYLWRGEVAQLFDANKISQQQGGHVIEIRADKKQATLFKIDDDLWAQVSLTANVLDRDLTAPVPDLSEDARYYEFRNFLAASAAKPQWDGYKENRRFNLPRSYEAELLDTVVAELKKADQLKSKAVVLHGQSGVGKTVALGALAMSVAQMRLWPTLFIENRAKRPTVKAVANFCSAAEEAGAIATLIVWDGMRDIDEYGSLFESLASQGRKVLVVGSTYTSLGLQGRRLHNVRVIEAPSVFDDEEKDRLASLLREFGVDIEDALRHIEDSAYLSVLYRMLPSSRPSIRRGLFREAAVAEEHISREMARIDIGATALGQALQLALQDTFPDLLVQVAPTAWGAQTAADLVGIVMVPGQFGLKVPVALAIRALGDAAFKQIGEIAGVYRDVDIVRWEQDSVGNVFLTARSRLEANILTRFRHADVGSELNVVKRLVLAVNSPDNEEEMEFVISLVSGVSHF